MNLTVLICTHNRFALLQRTLDYLNRAKRPECTVQILVLANACDDGTHELLHQYTQAGAGLPLRWASEPTPGKSHALNRAIPLLTQDWVAFVDDDHRVHEEYLVSICRAASEYHRASLLCGRILPDWDGTEPAWVHDEGPYRIYPLPVPRQDLGDQPQRVLPGEWTPGGGNLVVRAELFAKVGGFSADYGPVGHDLGGGEDQEWVRRALAAGAELQYVPSIVQYHYVDAKRLTLGYLLKKAYQRSASVVRLSSDTAEWGILPAYMIRKVAHRSLGAILSLSQDKRRFHLVRMAAALGEIKGHFQARRERMERLSRDEK